MATHSNILAWKIPWIEEPRSLKSMGLQRGEHDLATKQQQLYIYIYIYIYICRTFSYINTHLPIVEERQVLAGPWLLWMFLKAVCILFLGEAWWAAVHGVAKSRTRLSGFTFTFLQRFRFWLSTEFDDSLPESKQNPSGHLALSATSYIWKDYYL